jgi:hypothetical protein
VRACVRACARVTGWLGGGGMGGKGAGGGVRPAGACVGEKASGVCARALCHIATACAMRRYCGVTVFRSRLHLQAVHPRRAVDSCRPERAGPANASRFHSRRRRSYSRSVHLSGWTIRKQMSAALYESLEQSIIFALLRSGDLVAPDTQDPASRSPVSKGHRTFCANQLTVG